MIRRNPLTEKLSLQSNTTAQELFVVLSQKTGLRFTLQDALTERVNLLSIANQTLKTILDTLCEINNWKWKQVSETEIKVFRPKPLVQSDIRLLAGELTMLLPGDSLRYLSASHDPQAVRALFDAQGFFLDMQAEFLKKGPLAFSTLKPALRKRLLEHLMITALISTKNALTRSLPTYHYALSTRIKVHETDQSGVPIKNMTITGFQAEGAISLSTRVRLPGDPP